tara:strand:- start:151 stop:486 length:336 start_codon:yes stop_codon:yes gene_type:complete
MLHFCSTLLTATLMITTGVLAGCASTQPARAGAGQGGSFPDSVNAFGDGYPVAGAPCRRLGEARATAAYLDHMRTLAGCLTRSDADALGGQIVGHIDGVWMISIPSERLSP